MAAMTTNSNASALGARTAEEADLKKVADASAPAAPSEKKRRVGDDYSFTLNQLVKVDPARVHALLGLNEVQIFYSDAAVPDDLMKKLTGPAVVVAEIRDDDRVEVLRSIEDRYATNEKPKPTFFANNALQRAMIYKRHVNTIPGGKTFRVVGLSSLVDGFEDAMNNAARVQKGLQYPMVVHREALKAKEKIFIDDIMAEDGKTAMESRFAVCVNYVTTYVLPRLLSEELHAKQTSAVQAPVFYVWNGYGLQPVYVVNSTNLDGDEKAKEIAGCIRGLVTPKAFTISDPDKIQKLKDEFAPDEPDPDYFTFDEKKGVWKVKCDYKETMRGEDLHDAHQKFLCVGEELNTVLLGFMQNCIDQGYKLSRWGQHYLLQERVQQAIRDAAFSGAK